MFGLGYLGPGSNSSVRQLPCRHWPGPGSPSDSNGDAGMAGGQDNWGFLCHEQCVSSHVETSRQLEQIAKPWYCSPAFCAHLPISRGRRSPGQWVPAGVASSLTGPYLHLWGGFQISSAKMKAGMVFYPGAALRCLAGLKPWHPVGGGVSLLALPGSSYLVPIRSVGTAGDNGFMGTGPQVERKRILKQTWLHKAVLWQEFSPQKRRSVGIVFLNLKLG